MVDRASPAVSIPCLAIFDEALKNVGLEEITKRAGVSG